MLDQLVASCLRWQAIIFNEGKLVLDGCDFSKNSASVLVFTDDTRRTIVRNAILGDLNCEFPSRYNVVIERKCELRGAMNKDVRSPPDSARLC